jgi:hypothetical protein
MWKGYCKMQIMMRGNHFKIIVAAGVLFGIASCTDQTTTPTTDKYLGSWSCKETPATGGPTTFTITISNHGSGDTLDVYNFDNLGVNEKAIFIVNDNSVVIPAQTVSGFSVSGYGTYSSGKINLNYAVDSDNYTAVCTQ